MRKSKLSDNDVVAPDEEEEEWNIRCCVLRLARCYAKREFCYLSHWCPLSYDSDARKYVVQGAELYPERVMIIFRSTLNNKTKQESRTKKMKDQHTAFKTKISMILCSPLLWRIPSSTSSWLFDYRRVWMFYLKSGNEFGSSSGSDFWRVRMIARSGYYHCHIRPSVIMYQRGSHWTDSRKILYCGLSWKSVQEVQIWLKFNKNIGHFTWRSEYILLLPAT